MHPTCYACIDIIKANLSTPSAEVKIYTNQPAQSGLLVEMSGASSPQTPGDYERRIVRVMSISESEGHGTNELPAATEQEALECIKDSLAAGEGETDYDASVTHVFIVLGASVSTSSIKTLY